MEGQRILLLVFWVILISVYCFFIRKQTKAAFWKLFLFITASFALTIQVFHLLSDFLMWMQPIAYLLLFILPFVTTVVVAKVWFWIEQRS
ncbi:hypothetical protein SAMN05421788_106301 [Filimonas lacunae]|uniref:Uncharacterized protein n=1 Tax=Filimonas lacunae TaxID=477680 RepID=A0A173MF59_9BACT|nr:hypothetical protein [Filimonas lacunae]BAV06234.1 hypothetical protein FLA_2250 [Filimonas lacunae]SIT25387.1 hypothetical protein SAMN05421788_106301 [Filimonas lacunae]